MSQEGLSDEMLKIVTTCARSVCAQIAGRSIQTPHYVAVTSRGVIPHLSPDVLQKHTRISLMYYGLEDCKFHIRAFPSTTC